MDGGSLNLYSLRLTLYRGAEAPHAISERFDSHLQSKRAVLNGRRSLKGVGRHAFRRRPGRALTAG